VAISEASIVSLPLRYATIGSGRATVRGRYHGCWDWLKGPFSAVSIVPRVSPSCQQHTHLRYYGKSRHVGVLTVKQSIQVSIDSYRGSSLSASEQ
jgi:hypothetical protein